MTRVRVEGFTISLDGYGAGPNQDIDHPLGVGGTELLQWFFLDATFQGTLFGKDGARPGLTTISPPPAFENRGPGFWAGTCSAPFAGRGRTRTGAAGGGEPPYHVPAFVLTHYPRAAAGDEGGTTFHFVTDGIGAALEQAPGGRRPDVRIGGGAPPCASTCARRSSTNYTWRSPVLLGRRRAPVPRARLAGAWIRMRWSS